MAMRPTSGNWRALLLALVVASGGPGMASATEQALPPPVGPATPRVEPVRDEDGLYRQRWFLLSFLNLEEDFAEARAAGKRFAVVFEQRGCPYCIRLHTEILPERYINDYMRENFAVLQLDIWGAREVTDFDGKVLSAPNINEPILGGSAQISGSFTVETANQLAIALRSGALPVDLKVIEERTVGPDLGADSINKGLIAMLVGTVALATFIIVTYGRFGLYACAALVINMLMILGVMAIANSTLTLPGIAGFVLTIGAAVDANVLINERIREERAKGRRVVQAVEVGYKEASRAIFDANITNVIAAVLMFLFGSGPIRGFAVVLMIGIVTSVFTAVTLTRMWVANWLRRARPADIVL